MEQIPIVAIRSNDNCFLDILRCCGIADIPVVPVIYTWESAGYWYSEHSRYYSNPVQICNPAENELASIADLKMLGKKLYDKHADKILLVPSSDTSHVLIQKYFDELSPYYYQMGARDFQSSIYDIASKDVFCQKLHEAGICIPETFPCFSTEDIHRILNVTSFPCVYKPVLKDNSNTFYKAHRGLKAIECSDREMLADLLHKEIGQGFRLIVQEKIIFCDRNDEYSCYVYAGKNHKALMISGQYKLDEYPKPYGTGFVSKFHANREVFAIAEKVVEALEWRGFIGIEFMRDKKDGKWKVIEANFRPWLSIYFQASQGYNFIEYLYKDTYGLLGSLLDPKVASSDDSYSVFRINFGVFWNKARLGYSPQEILDYLQDWFNAHHGRYVFTNYVDHDPLPGIREFEQMIQNADDPYRGILLLLLAFLGNRTDDSVRMTDG